MLSLLGGLKSFVKYKASAIKEGQLFRIHCMLTTAALLACSVIITASQYVGDPITCLVGNDRDKAAINTYCWITSTFTMADAHYRKPGSEVAHPGVGPDYYQGEAGERRYHSYYQWVCFILFFQAMLCFVPKHLWKSFEGGRLENILMGLNTPCVKENEINDKKQLIVQYFRTCASSRCSPNSTYALRYFFCEFLCLVNVVGQLFLMDWFLGGEFFRYGRMVVSFTNIDQEDRYDPMIYVFPRVTKCLFHKYGPTGTIQISDHLCILPLNIVNEKVYVFIWFWFIILTGLLICLIIYRGIILTVPWIRPYLLNTRNTLLKEKVIKRAINGLGCGDFWLLYLLAKNMDPHIFYQVVKELARTPVSVDNSCGVGSCSAGASEGCCGPEHGLFLNNVGMSLRKSNDNNATLLV